MKLIIEIDDDVYKNPFNYCCYALANDIKNGTPLPENHGRIVDLDTVTVEEDTDKGVLWLDAPTILEASYGK